MNTDEFTLLVQDIVKQACELKNKHTKTSTAPVNYAAIFSHTRKEFESLVSLANTIGEIVRRTPTGPLFHIKPLNTIAGTLKLLKIRLPDPSRPERGDADFTITDFSSFKKACDSKSGFSLIRREGFEMIELVDPAFHVRAYFSHPPLDKQLGLSSR